MSAEAGVKSARRVFEILEYFAALRAPATLTEIASALDLPKSSCLALLETMQACGYAYANADGRYYLTQRWLDGASAVAAHDQVVARVRPVLKNLKARIGETLILAQRAGDQSLYLDVAEADHVLRFAAHVGQMKPVACAASGRAVLGLLPLEARAAEVAQLKLKRHSRTTITDRDTLLKTINAGAAAGWHVSYGEYQADTISIAAPMTLWGSAYALVVGAPSSRIKDRVEEIGRALLQAARKLEQGEPAARRAAAVH